MDFGHQGMACGFQSGAVMKVSVIMPAFNAQAWIKEAIRSVLDQDHRDLELIVVDNNSSDGTALIVASIEDPRIVLLHEPRQGVAAARNKALDRMSGDCFCFLDADDLMPQGSLSDRIGRLRSDRSIMFVDGIVQLMDARAERVLSTWRPAFEGMPYHELLSLSGRCFLGITWLVRRVEGCTYRFDERLTHAEDLLFLISIARGGNYTHVPVPVLKYRRGHPSAMSDLNGLQNGYAGLVRSLRDLDPPPDEQQLRTLWARVRRIMWRSFLKKRKPLRAIAAAWATLPGRWP